MSARENLESDGRMHANSPKQNHISVLRIEAARVSVSAETLSLESPDFRTKFQNFVKMSRFSHDVMLENFRSIRLFFGAKFTDFFGN